MLEYLESLDRTIFLLINGFNSPFFDHVMWFISGKFSWAPLYAVLLFFSIKQEKKHWWLLLLSIALLITLADQTSVKAFKEVFLRYRPCHNLELEHLVHKVNGKCGGKYGFVSSHAANAFALAGFMSFIFNKRNITILLLLWAGLVSYSRVYLGVHYPADIFCGALLGLCCSVFVFKLYQWFKPLSIRKKELV